MFKRKFLSRKIISTFNKRFGLENYYDSNDILLMRVGIELVLKKYKGKDIAKSIMHELDTNFFLYNYYSSEELNEMQNVIWSIV